ncbi:MAG: hypothetical protein WCN95_01670 [bacterium]
MPTSPAWIGSLEITSKEHAVLQRQCVTPVNPAREFSPGFSFVEVLIALTILIILATVVLSSHVGIIRAENRVRSLQESRLVAGRIAGEVWLATSALETVGSDIEGWNVQFEPAVREDNTNQLTWNRWTISPSNDPGSETVIYLRPPPARTNAATGATRTGGPFTLTPRPDSVPRPGSSQTVR